MSSCFDVIDNLLQMLLFKVFIAQITMVLVLSKKPFS